MMAGLDAVGARRWAGASPEARSVAGTTAATPACIDGTSPRDSVRSGEWRRAASGAAASRTAAPNPSSAESLESPLRMREIYPVGAGMFSGRARWPVISRDRSSCRPKSWS